MYSEIRSHGADLLSVAVDLQGPDLPRPYHEQAGAEFTTVVDEENSLARVFGYKAIPNGVLVDENGVLQYQKYGGFNIKNDEAKELVMSFFRDGDTSGDAGEAGEGPASDHFERGLALYQQGDVEGARAVWRDGIEHDPLNWNMRKQLWAIENPDKFYDGAVDYGWQKEQVESGR